MYTGEDDEAQEPVPEPRCDSVEFYRIMRSNYTIEEMHGMAVRAACLFKLAAERGLIPWEYDGQREDLEAEIHDNATFDWPEPPQWGKAA